MRQSILTLAATLAAATAALGIGGSAGAATIISSTADFEAQIRTSGGTTSDPNGPRVSIGLNSGADGITPSSTGNSVAGTVLRVGTQTGFANPANGQPLGGITSVFFFQLPALAAGESISGADFSISLLRDLAASGSQPLFGGDLYALGFTNTPASNASYFFAGPSPADSAAATGDTGAGFGGPGVLRALIQDDLLQPADFIPNGTVPPAAPKSTGDGGDAALLAYVNSLYANQAATGFVPGTSSLILRINPDAASYSGAATQRYSIIGAENPSAYPKPTLTLDVVPEPGSVALLALGGLTLLTRRRRREV